MSDQPPEQRVIRAPRRRDEQPTEETQVPETQDWASQVLSNRPRRRLLTGPTVLLLIAVFAVGGFLVGVQIEKGQVSSSSTAASGRGAAFRSALTGGGSGSLRSLLGGSGASGSAGSGSASGLAGLFGRSSGTQGTVTSVSGSTLDVTESSGNIVALHVPAGVEVERTTDSSVGAIHPGETVTFTGTTGADGSITAATLSSNATAAALTAGLGSSTTSSGG
jgi:hypothetical protein